MQLQLTPSRFVDVVPVASTRRIASIDALRGFNIFWILGGKAKAGGIANLTEFFPRVRKAYLIGEATEEFAATLDGQVPYLRCVTLDYATEAAAADAERSGLPAPVVLLSPACASFDQYRNFEVRGDAFRKLVHGLAGIRPS